MNKGWILAYVLLNVLTFTCFALDKKRAQKGKQRLRESTLLGLSFVGGTLGALFAMFSYRHKTSKKSFLIKMGLVIITQWLLVYFLIKRPDF